MYKIYPFLLHKTEESITIQNKNSIVILKNDELIKLFTYLDTSNTNQLSDDILSRFMDDKNFERIYDFLLKKSLIYYAEIPEMKFSNILLISNSKEFIEVYLQVYKKNEVNSEIANFTNYKEKMEDKDYDLCIIFSSPFNLIEYNEINTYLSNYSIIIKNIFYYNYSIYLSNYYRKSWKNPCPICFFSNLEEQLRNNISNQTVGFQTIIDLIYKNNPRFKIEVPLDRVDIVPILYVLILEMKNVKFDYIIDEVTEISLFSYKITSDFAFHWELCDCYE